MRHSTIAGLLSGIVLAGLNFNAFADVKENPFQSITARNAFRLRTILPPETVKTPELAVIPPREIKLTGITTLSGVAKATFQVEDKQTKKTDFPAPLAAGESYNGITIMAINVENNTVRIKDGDAEATLDFVNHGVKPAATALAASTIPIQLVAHAATPLAFATPTGAFSNNRSIIAGGDQPYDPNRQRAVQQPRMMTRDEVDARIELEREIRRQNSDPTYKLLPPTKSGETPNSLSTLTGLPAMPPGRRDFSR